jgi:hypothetical protein
MRSPVLALALAFALALAGAACNDGTAVTQTAFQPQIVTAQGPQGGVVTCDPTTAGGNCALPIAVTFRLPQGQFVWKAFVRFHGDGSDDGVDHGYPLQAEPDAGTSQVAGLVFGNGDTPVTVNVAASVPPTILRRGALFTYTVRLVSGNGVESQASTLTVSVQ